MHPTSQSLYGGWSLERCPPNSLPTRQHRHSGWRVLSTCTLEAHTLGKSFRSEQVSSPSTQTLGFRVFVKMSTQGLADVQRLRSVWNPTHPKYQAGTEETGRHNIAGSLLVSSIGGSPRSGQSPRDVVPQWLLEARTWTRPRNSDRPSLRTSGHSPARPDRSPRETSRRHALRAAASAEDVRFPAAASPPLAPAAARRHARCLRRRALTPPAS